MSTNLQPVILESWERQTRIFTNLIVRIDGSNAHLKPSEDGWPIAQHLCHLYSCRCEWLGTVAPEFAPPWDAVWQEVDGNWKPIDDLDEIKRQLALSGEALAAGVKSKLDEGVERVGPYDHPIFFLQHMVWHEGYHFGLIMLALRLGGQEPPEEWEERNVWGIWRDPEV